MSTGVCIINRNGVALAADSAGTYSGKKMFYNSLEKVFSLSEKYIHGAIAYGNLSINSVSVEQVLKEFQLYIDERKCIDDFFDIVSIFQAFINEKNRYFRFDQAEEVYCYTVLEELVNKWGTKIKNIITATDAEAQIDMVFSELDTYMKSCQIINDFDIDQYIKTTYRVKFDQLIDSIVPELKAYPGKIDSFWDMLSDYFRILYKLDTQNKTGLFFAGYGKNDAFPKFIHISLYRIIGGKLKFIEEDRFGESYVRSQIVPLAQSDVILTFCRGISSVFLSFIPTKMQETIDSKINALPASEFTDQQKQSLRVSFENSATEVIDAVKGKMQSENVDPIIESVSLIPLAEMAFLAESLVNITTLKRTYSIDGNQQTVGGPTDVAVLSKGDGFVWIRKKHFKVLNAIVEK